MSLGRLGLIQAGQPSKQCPTLAEMTADAYSYYSGKVTKEQRAISRALLSIFKNWYEQPFGELTSDTFKIQSMLYGSTNNTN